MPTYHEFKAESVRQALGAAQAHNEAFGLKALDENMNLLGGGEFAVLAECIKVTVEENKICLSLPLGIGKVCLPIPISIPNGTAAEACLDICTTWGIPTGIKVSVSALGHVIVEKSFGRC